MMVGQRGGRRPDALLQNPPSVISDRFVVQEAKTEMAADRDRQRVSSREVTCTVVPEDELHSLLLAALAGAWCAGAHSTVPCHHHCPLSLQRPETYYYYLSIFINLRHLVPGWLVEKSDLWSESLYLLY